MKTAVISAALATMSLMFVDPCLTLAAQVDDAEAITLAKPRTDRVRRHSAFQA